MKTIEVNGVTVTYDINKLVEQAKGIEYPEDGQFTFWDEDDNIPEEDFNRMREEFAAKIAACEDELPQLIEGRLYLTKKGILHRSRRRPVIEGPSGFYTRIEDQYDHDPQVERPIVELVRTGDNEGVLRVTYRMS